MIYTYSNLVPERTIDIPDSLGMVRVTRGDLMGCDQCWNWYTNKLEPIDPEDVGCPLVDSDGYPIYDIVMRKLERGQVWRDHLNKRRRIDMLVSQRGLVYVARLDGSEQQESVYIQEFVERGYGYQQVS